MAITENVISLRRIPRLFNVKGQHTGHSHDMVSLLEVVGYNSILSGALSWSLCLKEDTKAKQGTAVVLHYNSVSPRGQSREIRGLQKGRDKSQVTP